MQRVLAHTLDAISHVSPRHQYWFHPRRRCTCYVMSLASGVSPYSPGTSRSLSAFCSMVLALGSAALAVRQTSSSRINGCDSTAGVLETGRGATVGIHQDWASQRAMSSHKRAPGIQALCQFRLFPQTVHLSKQAGLFWSDVSPGLWNNDIRQSMPKRVQVGGVMIFPNIHNFESLRNSPSGRVIIAITPPLPAGFNRHGRAPTSLAGWPSGSQRRVRCKCRQGWWRRRPTSGGVW